MPGINEALHAADGALLSVRQVGRLHVRGGVGNQRGEALRRTRDSAGLAAPGGMPPVRRRHQHGGIGRTWQPGSI